MDLGDFLLNMQSGFTERQESVIWEVLEEIFDSTPQVDQPISVEFGLRNESWSATVEWQLDVVVTYPHYSFRSLERVWSEMASILLDWDREWIQLFVWDGVNLAPFPSEDEGLLIEEE